MLRGLHFHYINVNAFDLIILLAAGCDRFEDGSNL